MNKIFPFIFLFYTSLFFSQSTLTVYRSDNQKPIKGAKVYCNDKLLGQTNEKGILIFTTKCPKVDVEIDNYIGDEVVVDKVMEIGLDRDNIKASEIQGVVLSNQSDPRALAIIDKVFRSFKNNSPNSLDSYSYRSYEKMSFDVDEDSIKDYTSFYNARQDSLSRIANRKLPKKQKEIKDSIEGEQMMGIARDSKLFLWERAMQFLYSKKYGEKTNILDNRISGLKNPVYEMLALRSNRDKIPREILPENRSLYRYFLTDSIEIDGRDNYVIRFRQVDYKVPVNRRKYNGYLYIDKETYAIKKIESNSKVKTDGTITSVWIPINNKWFLKTENLKIKMGVSEFATVEKKENETAEEKKERLDKIKRFGNYAYMKSDYFDFQTPVDFKASQFSGYTMSVKNADGSLLDQYRTDSLTAREKLTYVKVDSLGKKYTLDRKVRVLTSLLRAKFTVGMVDISPLQTRYNKYEGFRPGATFKLNEKFNKYISPDVYLAYGFKDRGFKYGAGVDVRTTLERNSFFRFEYFNDVMASGRFSQNLWNAKMQINNNGMSIQNDKYYKFNGFKFGYEVDLSNSLTLNVSAKKQNEESGYPYEFMGMSRKFENFSSLATIKFSPNNRNIMTPAGKYTFEQNFPEVFFNYEQGYKSLGGEFNYSRFDVLYTHQFRTSLGLTQTRAFGGYYLGKAPIWHLFEMGGLDGNSSTGILSNFSLTSYLGFATMTAGKYFNDKFAGYYITHRIPWYFKSFGKSTSSFDFIYRGVIGDMKHPEYHQIENFSPLNHLYQEVGFEYNNFLSSRFNLGLFYRVGYYATSNFKDNFGVQLKLKLLEF
ncbi:hypothetical protein [Epilithonimonas hungarica]|uniref:Carboxypeptidase-like regulatory domain-containing protein n=1 Tax=Epilithonimonas hungarica TaxID=454006 RepID=A0A1G7IRY1_9FLAO|nr:hypothetical protein [Epilithonimonas hungarica]SDF15431.1 hypothetical protein SAMN05421825_1173 [Epilithonimonas hungarica]